MKYGRRTSHPSKAAFSRKRRQSGSLDENNSPTCWQNPQRPLEVNCIEYEPPPLHCWTSQQWHPASGGKKTAKKKTVKKAAGSKTDANILQTIQAAKTLIDSVGRENAKKIIDEL